MIELPFVIIESEQKRAYLAAVCAITKPADDAVSSAVTFDLQHCPLARFVSAIYALRYHAIERTTGLIQPRLSFAAVQRVGRELEQLIFSCRREILFECGAPRRERCVEEASSIRIK